MLPLKSHPNKFQLKNDDQETIKHFIKLNSG